MTLTCIICGLGFEWAQRGHQPHTCGSPECLKERHAKSVVEYRWRQRGGSTIQQRACNQCGSSFEFTRVQGMKGRGPGFCSEACRRERHLKQNREKRAIHWAKLPKDEQARRRRLALLARKSLNQEQYGAMLAAQGGVCAICKRPELRHHSPLLKIDHDRSCCPSDQSCGKCVRGLLCSNCNRAIGLLQDSPEILANAIGYLREYLAMKVATRP